MLHRFTNGKLARLGDSRPTPPTDCTIPPGTGPSLGLRSRMEPAGWALASMKDWRQAGKEIHEEARRLFEQQNETEPWKTEFYRAMRAFRLKEEPLSLVQYLLSDYPLGPEERWWLALALGLSDATTARQLGF